jgi:two-component system, response regulator YcbB
MLQTKFFIVDDDSGIRRILQNIIEDYQLGIVVGEEENGVEAEQRILQLKPDIILIDLLLPGQDGIEIVRKLKTCGSDMQFIMISQVRNHHMISKAYENGVEFFIDKPINVTEVAAVIRKVQEMLRLRRYLSIINDTVRGFETVPMGIERTTNELKGKINRVFSDLGILGEVGSHEILALVTYLAEEKREVDEFQLTDLYNVLANQSGKDNKAIEQRVRRTISKALQNIASLGIEDFYNDKFTQYSTTLFDFKEVKQEISFIKEKSPFRGKINVKKFLAGMTYLME